MIIFEPGGSKNLILIILVVFFLGIIAWQWVKSDPFSNVGGNNYFAYQLEDSTKESVEEFKNVRDNFDQGKESFLNVDDEIIKQDKQNQLIEEAKKYLEEKESDSCSVITNREDCLARLDCLAVDYCSCTTESDWYQQCGFEQAEICDCVEGYFVQCEKLDCTNKAFSRPDSN